MCRAEGQGPRNGGISPPCPPACLRGHAVFTRRPSPTTTPLLACMSTRSVRISMEGKRRRKEGGTTSCLTVSGLCTNSDRRSPPVKPARGGGGGAGGARMLRHASGLLSRHRARRPPSVGRATQAIKGGGPSTAGAKARRLPLRNAPLSSVPRCAPSTSPPPPPPLPPKQPTDVVHIAWRPARLGFRARRHLAPPQQRGDGSLPHIVGQQLRAQAGLADHVSGQQHKVVGGHAVQHGAQSVHSGQALGHASHLACVPKAGVMSAGREEQGWGARGWAAVLCAAMPTNAAADSSGSAA